MPVWVVAAVEGSVSVRVAVGYVPVGVDARVDSVVVGSELVLVADEVRLTVGVELVLLVGAGPADVPELLVGLEGVGVLRVPGNVGVIVGVVAEVAAPLNVVSELCVLVGDEVTRVVGVGDVRAGVSVEVRPVVAVSDRVVSADVGVSVVVGAVGISELTGDGVTVVAVSMV